MKSARRALGAVLVGWLCLLAAPASAQMTRTAQGRSEAVVIASMQLAKAADLRFGRVLVNGGAGSVVINPATDTCQYSALLVSGGSCAAARFVGMGGKKMRFRITLPTSITLTGPGAPMTVDTFTVGTNSSVTPPSGNSPGNGNQRYTIETDSGIFDFKVGATLRVNANQGGGTYSGTFTVQVNYN